MNPDTLVPLLIFLQYALLFLDYDVDEECEFPNSKSSALGSCLAFA